MAGGVERLLTAYQHVLVGRWRLVFPPPLVRSVMRWSGVQNGIAAYYYAKAQAFANRGEYEKSIHACQASLTAQPDNMAANVLLAQTLTHTQRYEEALALFGRFGNEARFRRDLDQSGSTTASAPAE